MFSPLRNRFGIPGVISVIALVFAMFGGAYAASNSSDGDNATASAKGKQGPRGKRGKPGPPGPAGPAGPAGAKGDTGAAGSNGSNGSSGKDGTSAESVSFAGNKAGTNITCTEGGLEVKSGSPTLLVCNGKKGTNGTNGAPGSPGAPGEPWTAGGTLPPGETETGAWSVIAPTGEGIDSISFNIPLPAPLDEAHVLVLATGYDGEDGVGAEHEKCPGKAANPKAKAGYLCVYTGSVVGTPTVSVYDPSTSSPLETKGAQPSGAVIFAAGGELAVGTWAVTAPTS